MPDHQHHFKYNERERLKLQDPRSILKSIGLKKGMTFIDLGSNDGFFTLPAAKIVGEKGKIIALDIDQEALSKLTQKLKKEKINNTITILGPAEKSLPFKNIADIIFLGTVLHDFKDPAKVLKNSRKMLKDNGLIYDFDWRKIKSKLGPPFEIRLSQEEVKKLAQEAELKIKSTDIINDLFYEVKLKK